jgi:hypothetical protein
MNHRRILAFVALLLVVTAAASFPFGFIRGFLAHSTGSEPPLWLLPAQALAVLIASIAVIAILAKRQREKTWEHAWNVAIVSWLVSFPLNVLLLRQPWLVWARGFVVLTLVVFVGVPLGVYLRRFSGNSFEPQPGHDRPAQ